MERTPVESNKVPQKPNNLLKHEREKRGWSQSKLGELIGADPTMISRWERGNRNPERIYQEKLCQVFNKNTIELGFVKQPEIIAQSFTSSLSHNDLIEDTETLDRLQRRTSKKHYNIDETTLNLLEATNKNNWCLYAKFENSVLYRKDMLHGLSGQLQTISNLLDYSQPDQIQARLSLLTCDIMQIMGEIFFDLKDSSNAKKYYNTALTLAKENQNNLSLATTLGRISFIYMYDDNPQKALEMLHNALNILPDQTPDIIRVWLLTRLAEAHAILYHSSVFHKDESIKTLDEAEYYLNRSKNEDLPNAFSTGAVNAHMNHSIFRGYQGACYTHLQIPSKAQEVLLADLNTTKTEQDIHNAIVHIDLAKTYTQQREIEETYKHTKEALIISSQLKSARVLQRISTLLEALEPWKKTVYVKDINEQMSFLQATIIQVKGEK